MFQSVDEREPTTNFGGLGRTLQPTTGMCPHWSVVVGPTTTQPLLTTTQASFAPLSGHIKCWNATFETILHSFSQKVTTTQIILGTSLQLQRRALEHDSALVLLVLYIHLALFSLLSRTTEPIIHLECVYGLVLLEEGKHCSAFWRQYETIPVHQVVLLKRSSSTHTISFKRITLNTLPIFMPDFIQERVSKNSWGYQVSTQFENLGISWRHRTRQKYIYLTTDYNSLMEFCGLQGFFFRKGEGEGFSPSRPICPPSNQQLLTV